jgi:predicted Zn-dependent peptidase
VKDTWNKELDTSLGSDRYVAAMLQRQLYVGRSMDVVRKLRATVQALTAADIARVAKRLDPARVTVVDAGDQTKAKAGGPAPASK